MPRPWDNPALRALLIPLSWIWSPLVRLRRAAYRRGWLTSHAFDVPVISVGNLTVGGTGKTPLVSTILELLPERLRPAMVLSRGYGPPVERDGVVLNDEGHMLRLRHPDAVMAQAPDRVAAAGMAMTDREVRCIILDDGAQHLQIRRDLDIVVVDARSLLDTVRILPAGPWRESPAALAGADLIVLTHVDLVDAADRGRPLERLAAWSDAPVVPARHRPTSVSEPAGTGAGADPGGLAGRRVGLVSAIGSPGAFRRTVEALGAEVAWRIDRPDHHGFTAQDREAVHARAADTPVDLVLVTEKDALKVAGFPESTRVLRVELALDDGGKALEDALRGL